jgi:hypothetical protein
MAINGKFLIAIFSNKGDVAHLLLIVLQEARSAPFKNQQRL